MPANAGIRNPFALSAIRRMGSRVRGNDSGFYKFPKAKLAI